MGSLRNAVVPSIGILLQDIIQKRKMFDAIAPVSLLTELNVDTRILCGNPTVYFGRKKQI
jgi:hypothetical protein